MKEIQVVVKDTPGELADIAEILGNHNINIRSIASETRKNGVGILRIVPKDNEDQAAKLLSDGGYKIHVNPLLVIRVIDRPGELAKKARLIARQGINVTSIYLIETRERTSGGDETLVALSVDNFSKAEKLLKPFVVNK